MITRTRRASLLLLPLLALCLNTNIASAASSDHWVGTWATSPFAAANHTDPSGALQMGSADTTFREIVHVSLGGSVVRIILSNEFGTDPLTIGAANIALTTGHGEIDPTSASTLTFGGRPTVTIPPGALVVSDPANLKLSAFAEDRKSVV